jgi:hypothetical protein
MESGPAFFAGTCLALFGLALLLWTGSRARSRRPVAEGVPQWEAVVLGTVLGTVSATGGAWLLLWA